MSKKEIVEEVKNLGFEEAISQLENIVRNLESGKVKLEDAVDAYEKGIILKNHCEKKLSQAKARIDKITINEDGNSSTQAFGVE